MTRAVVVGRSLAALRWVALGWVGAVWIAFGARVAHAAAPHAAPQSAPAPAPSGAPSAPAPPAGAGGPTQANPPTSAPDPLVFSDALRARIGSDAEELRDAPGTEAKRSFYGVYYSEERAAMRFELSPLHLSHTRFDRTAQSAGSGALRLTAPDIAPPAVTSDRESLYAFLYYQRRSPTRSADVLFPLFWHVKDPKSDLWALPPFVHREGVTGHDNWLAPLVFEGKRKDGGYFHMPLLLTIAWKNEGGAFTLGGPYFRSRSKEDVDTGIAPLWFHGDNGNEEGNRRRYTLVPPLLYYSRYRELDRLQMDLLGPVLIERNAKRKIVDVFPVFYRIDGRPEASGVRENHTTLFPFFHYGETPEESLLVVPGYLRKTTRTSDTMLTLFFSRATTRSGAQNTYAVGPIVPLLLWSTDRDTGQRWTALAPLYFAGRSNESESLLTPLFGRFERYGLSKTYWFLPTVTYDTNIHGYEADLHPIVYFGRSRDSSHGVVAPLYWDFKSSDSRFTLALPILYRGADYEAGSETQVVVNTLYTRKPSGSGHEWQFHFLPVFSVGQGPESNFWNVLFGFAGYSNNGGEKTLRALWIPIPLGGGSKAATARAQGVPQYGLALP